MKILLGSLTYPLPNGVTNSINTSLDGFVAQGHTLRIVAPDYHTGVVRPEHQPVSSSRILQIVSNPLGNGERFFSIKAAAQIQNIITDFQPDAFWLHTVTWAPNIFEVLMNQQSKPKVVTYHTNIDYYGRVYAGKVGERHMAERSRDVCEAADRVIVPSQWIATKLRSLRVTKPISVIPTGIQPAGPGMSPAALKKHYRIPAPHKVLLFTGRLVREKNISALLVMMRDLLKIRHDVTLLLIGPGNHDEFETEAKNLGITKNVVMQGAVSAAEVRRQYAAADIFVSASQHETQGLVFGEAMDANLPIVALDSPIRSQFYPENVAVVIKDEHQFAREVDLVLDDAELRQRLVENSQQFFTKNLTVEQMIKSQTSLFRSLVGSEGLESPNLNRTNNY